VPSLCRCRFDRGGAALGLTVGTSESSTPPAPTAQSDAFRQRALRAVPDHRNRPPPDACFCHGRAASTSSRFATSPVAANVSAPAGPVAPCKCCSIGAMREPSRRRTGSSWLFLFVLSSNEISDGACCRSRRESRRRARAIGGGRRVITQTEVEWETPIVDPPRCEVPSHFLR
jgi:hypothetical protein